MLGPLRQRSFALVWFGGLISVSGDWVLYAALPFYVYIRTGSTLATTGMIAAELGPSIVIGPFAGVFVDRWDRRRTMAVTSLLEGLAVGLLILVSIEGWLWIVYVAGGVQATLAAFFMPAEGALLPALVSKDELIAANSLISINNSVARLAGPAIGGFLLGLGGLPTVVFVDSASFVFAALMIGMVTSLSPAARDAPVTHAGSAWKQFLTELTHGFEIARRERRIAVLVAVFGLMTFGGTMFDPLYPAFVHDVLRGGPPVFGWLLTAFALGGLVGGLVIGQFGATATPGKLIGWGSIGAAIVLLVLFNVPWLPVTLTLAVAAGVPSTASRIGSTTAVQTLVEDAYRGRILGLLGASGGLFSLAGAWVGGTGAEVVGVVPMLDTAAGLTFLAGVAALAALVPKRRTSGKR